MTDELRNEIREEVSNILNDFASPVSSLSQDDIDSVVELFKGDGVTREMIVEFISSLDLSSLKRSL